MKKTGKPLVTQAVETYNFFSEMLCRRPTQVPLIMLQKGMNEMMFRAAYLCCPRPGAFGLVACDMQEQRGDSTEHWKVMAMAVLLLCRLRVIWIIY